MPDATPFEPRVDDRGLQLTWLDADDEPREAPEATVAALREVIGTPPDDLAARGPLVSRPGRDLGLGAVRVVCEDGSRHEVDGPLPADFPLGYHRLTTAEGVERRLVVSPGRCWTPEQPTWGWAVQLYAARSRAGWGIGDLGDLAALRRWTERLGGGLLVVNPLHAVGPSVPQEASPYLPATRRFRNPLYLRVEDVPGWDDALLAELDLVEDLAAARATDLVDRDRVWPLKARALRAVLDRSGPGERPEGAGDDFAAWRRAEGEGLERFALWSVVAGDHGADWHTWPEALRDPDGPAVADLARERADDVTFHAWLQWLLDAQLRAASGDLTVVQDLPIGVSGGGSDAWSWQGVLADGVTVGAPPDALNSSGQDWGSPPLVPWRLQEADYEPFVEAVRATLAGAGGLRVDHVMGLFRLWWIPEGAEPTQGAYVRYPSDDLLDIVALESHRARAVVVGEDLGTVEPGVREALAERDVLTYRVLWFEDEEPATWPTSALATVTTHDLPTVAGLWTGSDVEDQLASSDMDPAAVRAGREELRERLLRHDALAPDDGPDRAVAAAYERLAQAPCLMLSLSLEDALGEERRPNVPGTTERPNWCLPLPLAVEDLVAGPADHLAQRVAGRVAEHGAGRGAGRAADGGAGRG
ncbi:4-alpha-glucanotransferase [Nocardioides sp. Leaf374]|uniref:4-alpha-glucanotransferase n=1 Tax=Nocardioides sp. Leaf374 TaxID=2876560 RepID=UPI001E41ED80|nr:4-alpha-glucanotransferase [Nocardioides sp. Leaf374]